MPKLNIVDFLGVLFTSKENKVARCITETLSDLTRIQRCYMSRVLDRNTGYGLGSINSVMRGESGDLPLLEVFARFDVKLKKAKSFAREVLNFNLPPKDLEIWNNHIENLKDFHSHLNKTIEVEERFIQFRKNKYT